ncbi:MAG: S1 RNA-binding domain-containing protein [Clostridia bacterium]|nr:S1 RNA-binding domain-containing protein [Clostridia bacterium]
MTQIEIGSILEGKVTKVAAFGAFVALPEGRSGMVHISELSDRFIKDITAEVHVGDTLRVKVIAVDERGRISLSVKGARTPEEIAAEQAQIAAERKAREAAKRAENNRFTGIPGEYTPYIRREQTGDGSFEDMMSRFKTVSDEKMSDLRKYTEGKRGSGNGRRRK